MFVLTPVSTIRRHVDSMHVGCCRHVCWVVDMAPDHALSSLDYQLVRIGCCRQCMRSASISSCAAGRAGSKISNWEGGTRGVSFLSGGFLAKHVRGIVSHHMLHVTGNTTCTQSAMGIRFGWRASHVVPVCT